VDAQVGSLHYKYVLDMLMHMRTTLIIDPKLIARARGLTGIAEKTALVRAGLEALIAREAAKRLTLLGGTQPKHLGTRSVVPTVDARGHSTLAKQSHAPSRY
jgi:hypothetical protein